MQFNSLKFCVPAKVTIPVSCGLGDNSEKINTIISQEKIRLQKSAPPSASNFSAISCASYKFLSEINAGCPTFLIITVLGGDQWVRKQKVVVLNYG
jgi:hypothetical protein